MPSRIVIYLIGIVRSASGILAYVSPKGFAWHGMLPGSAGDHDSRYVTRLFGARDTVIGGLTLIKSTQSTALVAGAACDVMDTLSAGAAWRDGKEAKWARRSAAATGLFAIAGIFVITRRFASDEAESNDTRGALSAERELAPTEHPGA
jgi:hypothetical protein